MRRRAAANNPHECGMKFEVLKQKGFGIRKEVRQDGGIPRNFCSGGCVAGRFSFRVEIARNKIMEVNVKKNKWKMLAAALIWALLLPGRVLAEGGNEVRLDETGTVTMILPQAGEEGISSIQFSLLIDSPDAERAEFEFAAGSAKITEFRFHKEEKKLNVYIAGTEPLFAQGSDSLTIGKVIVLDGNGGSTTATVSVPVDSVQYVYGTELKKPEGLTSTGPVVVNRQDEEPGEDDRPGDDNSGEDDHPSDDNSGEDDNSGDDDNVSDEDSGDGNSGEENGSQNTGGSGQGTAGNGGQGTGGGSQSGAGAQGTGSGSQSGNGTQGTGGGTQTGGSGAQGTGTGSGTEAPATTASPKPSPEGNSGENNREPSITPEVKPAGSQDSTESSQEINWVMILAAAAIILFVGVAVMAAVVLNRKPKGTDFNDDNY